MPHKQKPARAPSPAEDLSVHITKHWPSQAAFARAAGISPVALSNYLVGRRGLSTVVAAAVQRTVVMKEKRSKLSLERLLGLAS